MAHAIGFPAIQFPQRRMPAAALSAAVDSTNLQGTRAHLAWARKFEETYKSVPIRSSGEGGLGGEALLLEKRPLPPAFPHPTSLEKGARGRGLFYRKGISLAPPLTIKELL